MSEAFSDQVLDLVRIALESANFTIRRHQLDDSQGELLLAENEFFVLGAVSAPTVDQLRLAETWGVQAMSELLASHEFGAKAWDCYLLLLTPQEPSDIEQATPLFDMNYNVRGIRRMARVGVASVSDVSTALLPFFPVASLAAGVALPSVLGEFESELQRQGADDELATRAVAAFSAGASLEDV